MRYIKSNSAKMSINDSVAKKQVSINWGRGVMVGVNKNRIDEYNRDDGNGNGDGNEGGGRDAVDTLRIDSATVREYHIQRIG